MEELRQPTGGISENEVERGVIWEKLLQKVNAADEVSGGIVYDNVALGAEGLGENSGDNDCERTFDGVGHPLSRGAPERGPDSALGDE